MTKDDSYYISQKSRSQIWPHADPNHEWLNAVKWVSEDKNDGRATIQKPLASKSNTQRRIIYVRGTKPGTLSNGLMGVWFLESSLSYSLPMSGESQWMVGTTVKHWEEPSSPMIGLYGQQYQQIWGHWTGRLSHAYITKHSGFWTTGYGFSQSPNPKTGHFRAEHFHGLQRTGQYPQLYRLSECLLRKLILELDPKQVL